MILREERGGTVARLARRHESGHPGAGLGTHRAAKNMEPVGNERTLGLEHGEPEPVRIRPVEVDSRSLIADETGEIGTGGVTCPSLTPARQAILEFGKPLVEPRGSQRWREVGDDHRVRAALGQRGLGRIVGGIEIDVRHLADQPVGPVARAKARLLAGHEFERAVHAEMQQDIGPPDLAQPEVEGREGMGRREALLEEKPHRVALVAEARLDADEDIAEFPTEDEDTAPVRTDPARRGAPGSLDLLQRRSLADDGVDIDMGRDIRLLPVARRIAGKDRVAQIIDRRGQIDAIALGLHPRERRVQAFEDREIGGGPHGPGIGRKAEKHDADLLVGIALAVQEREAQRLFRQRGDTFGTGGHGAAVGLAGAGQRAAGTAARPVAAGKDGGVGRAVDLGQSHEHGRLDRTQALRRGGPLAKRLELERLGGDVGHVEPREHLDCGGAVVIGGAADEREAGQ